jgi:hypothetical protein
MKHIDNEREIWRGWSAIFTAGGALVPLAVVDFYRAMLHVHTPLTSIERVRNYHWFMGL